MLYATGNHAPLETFNNLVTSLKIPLNLCWIEETRLVIQATNKSDHRKVIKWLNERKTDYIESKIGSITLFKGELS